MPGSIRRLACGSGGPRPTRRMSVTTEASRSPSWLFASSSPSTPMVCRRRAKIPSEAPCIATAGIALTWASPTPATWAGLAISTIPSACCDPPCSSSIPSSVCIVSTKTSPARRVGKSSTAFLKPHQHRARRQIEHGVPEAPPAPTKRSTPSWPSNLGVAAVACRHFRGPFQPSSGEPTRNHARTASTSTPVPWRPARRIRSFHLTPPRRVARSACGGPPGSGSTVGRAPALAAGARSPRRGGAGSG